MYTCELHCHTHCSSCSNLDPQVIIAACQQRGIDCIAITDHNTIAGALALQQIAPTTLQVIIGEEILTSEGELIAYFLQEEIPAHQSPEETIRQAHTQGAVIGISHPFDGIRGGVLKREALQRIKGEIDFIEGFNSRCLLNSWNRKALEFAKENDLPVTVGSDAHFKAEIGKALLLVRVLPSAQNFLDLIKDAQKNTHRSFVGIFLSKIHKHF